MESCVVSRKPITYFIQKNLPFFVMILLIIIVSSCYTLLNARYDQFPLVQDLKIIPSLYKGKSKILIQRNLWREHGKSGLHILTT